MIKLRYVTLVSFFLFSISSQAEWYKNTEFGLGFSTERDRHVDGETSRKQGVNALYGAYHLNLWKLSGEFNYSEDETGNSSLSVTNKTYRWMFWSERRFEVFRNSSFLKSAGLFAGAGVGLFQDQITTLFQSEESKAQSNWQFMYGLSVGADYLAFQHLVVNLFFRWYPKQDNTQQMSSLGLGLGYKF